MAKGSPKPPTALPSVVRKRRAFHLSDGSTYSDPDGVVLIARHRFDPHDPAGSWELDGVQNKSVFYNVWPRRSKSGRLASWSVSRPIATVSIPWDKFKEHYFDNDRALTYGTPNPVRPRSSYEPGKIIWQIAPFKVTDFVLVREEKKR